MEINYIEIISYVGSGFTLAQVCMKTMIPLRFFAMCSNVAFIIFSYQMNLPAILIVQCILLPINGFRLYQMRKLIRDVKAAAGGDLSVDWLIPYMSRMRTEKDQVLFRKGDAADELYYVQKGEVHLPEFKASRGAGSIIGEIGLFSPEGVRTSTVVCGEDSVILKISADKVYELYHQNPEFGFHMVRLITERLTRDIRRLEEQGVASKS